jgi:hypothetical protein
MIAEVPRSVIKHVLCIINRALVANMVTPKLEVCLSVGIILAQILNYQGNVKIALNMKGTKKVQIAYAEFYFVLGSVNGPHKGCNPCIVLRS